MTETNAIFPDPLDDLLRPRIPGETDESLRRRLLERTTRTLRGRRHLRIVVWAAALAACYVAGLLTMLWLAPRQIQVVEVVKPQAPPSPSPAPPAPAPDAPPAAPASAAALEWKAFDANKPRPDLYRQAGDQYLHDDDPASALAATASRSTRPRTSSPFRPTTITCS